MYSKRITSQTKEHSAHRDLISALLSEMAEGWSEGSWVHFEVVASGGWFSNLFSGGQPMIEVALKDATTFLLSARLYKRSSSIPDIPSGWKPERKGFWFVPISASEELVSWTDKYLADACGRNDYKITGWIEG